MSFTSVPGARLYWKLEGRETAPALILLNSIGTDMDLWDGLLPALRQHFRLLRIDTRGHGASTAEPGDLSLDLLARDILAVADDAGLPRFSLAGVSLGGMIGMQLALAQPARVERLALVCTSAAMDRQIWTKRVNLVRENGTAAIADAAMERFLSGAFRTAHPEVSATIERQLVSMDPAGYAGCAAAIRDMDIAPHIGGIRSPTLVVTGLLDSSTPFQGHGEYLVKEIARAEHRALPCAHLAPCEAPDELAQALITFLVV